MHRVLYIMMDMPSCHNSGLELCRRLAASGAEVSVACNRNLAEVVGAAGMDFHWLRADLDRRVAMNAERQQLDAMSLPMKLLKRFFLERSFRKESLCDTEVQDLLNACSPTLLLIDYECHVAIINSRASGIPTILCSRWFDMEPSENYPPLHSSLIPEDTWLSRLRVKWSWQRLWIYKWMIRLRESVSLARLRPLRYRTFQYHELAALIRARGLSLKDLTTNRQWLIPFAYRELPVVSLTSRSMDFPHATGSFFSYLGPMVPENNCTFSISEADKESIREFLARRESARQKLIYCSLGTWLTADQRLLEALCALMATRSDLALIIGLGAQASNITLDANIATKENILVLPAAPQTELLAQADLAILHAGIGSLNEALWHAVPSLVFSVDTNDQNGCAARMQHHCLGRVMSLDEPRVEVLEAAIDETLADVGLCERLLMQRQVWIREADPFETTRRLLAMAGLEPDAASTIPKENMPEESRQESLGLNASVSSSRI